MCLYDKIEITSWFYIYFTENKGMAFGMSFIGTMFLAIFRIIAILYNIFSRAQTHKTQKWQFREIATHSWARPTGDRPSPRVCDLFSIILVANRDSDPRRPQAHP